MRSTVLYAIAGLLAVLLLAGMAWIFFGSLASRADRQTKATHQMQKGSNPNLDVRFEYNPALLSIGPFVDNAEFPFLMEGEGWLLQGKRIRGMASLLHKQPVSALYDWLGVMQMEGLERYYDMKPAQDPLYEDWQVGERLAVHQHLVYAVSADKPSLPGYFPEAVLSNASLGSQIYIDGWVFFSEQDLFFFQAVSGARLTTEQLEACDEVLQSMQFNALLGGTGSAPEDEATPEQSTEPSEDAPGDTAPDAADPVNP